MLKNARSGFAGYMQWWMIQHGLLSVSLLSPSLETFLSCTGTVSIVSACIFNLVILGAYHKERGHSAGIREWSKYMFVSCLTWFPVCLFTCRTSLDCFCTSAPSSQHQLHFCGCLTLYYHLWCLYIYVCQLVCILTNSFWSFLLVSILFGILNPLPTSSYFLSCVIFCFVLSSFICWLVRLSLTWNLFSLRVDTVCLAKYVH